MASDVKADACLAVMAQSLQDYYKTRQVLTIRQDNYTNKYTDCTAQVTEQADSLQDKHVGNKYLY